MDQGKERKQYLDYLRIISCILIIFVHVSAWEMSKAENAILYQIINGLSLSGVSIFMMISGALFLGRDQEIPIRQILLKNVLRLLVVFYLWNGFYIVSSIVRNGLYDREMLVFYIKAMINGGGTYHLWFLPVLTGIYLTVPILQKCFKNDRKTETYFLVLFLLFAVILPFLFKMKVWGYATAKDAADRFELSFFTGYLGYFVLGHYLEAWITEKKKCFRLGLVFLISGVLQSLITGLIAWKTGEYYLKWNDAFTPLTTCYAIGAFLLLKCLFMGKRSEKKEKGFWRQVSGCTLGIYILHPHFLELYSSFLEGVIEIPVILEGFLLVAVLFVLCGCLTWLIRLIPFVGKYIT